MIKGLGEHLDTKLAFNEYCAFLNGLKGARYELRNKSLGEAHAVAMTG